MQVDAQQQQQQQQQEEEEKAVTKQRAHLATVPASTKSQTVRGSSSKASKELDVLLRQASEAGGAAEGRRVRRPAVRLDL
jgi:hypothetical protein